MADGVLDEARVAELIKGALGEFVTRDLKAALGPLAATLQELGVSVKAVTDKQAEASPPPKDGKAADSANLPAEVNALIDGLKKQVTAATSAVAEEKKAREAATQRALSTEQESKLQSVLGEFTFVNPEAKSDAHALLSPLIVRDADGNLVSKEGNLPLVDFVKGYLPEKKGHLLAPLNTSGTGAGAPGRRVAGKEIGMETIRPGMSPDETTAVLSQIRGAIVGQS